MIILLFVGRCTLSCLRSPMMRNASLVAMRYIQQKHKVSDGMSSDTIFAFLTLNTPRSAHNKIFGAKFLSFERAAIVC